MIMASSPSFSEFPVFIDTNLGTHLAISVSPDITSGDLKRKLGREHRLCFPNIGDISVHALMVKCKSCFYHIPDSVPIKSLFQGLKVAWFLQLNVSCIQHVHNQEAPLTDTVAMDETSPGNHEECARNANDSAKLQNEQSSCLVDHQPDSYKCLENKPTDLNADRHKLIHLENSSHITQKGQGASSSQPWIDCPSSLKESVGRDDASSPSGSDIISVTGTPSGSDIISVTGILTRYFCESDEVASEAKSRRTTTECSKQSNDSRVQKLEDGGHRFCASDVDDCNSQTTTRKKIRKHKILPFNGIGEAGLHLKVSHDSEDEHPLNQDHLDESIKASSTQAAKKCPPMQFSVRLSDSPITETPRSKLEKSEVGKRLLLAANGLGISTSKQKPWTKYCSRATKLSLPNSTALHRSVFEIREHDV